MSASEQHDAHSVAVGVDGSQPSINAARWALEQARVTGSRLEVISAWQEPGSWGMAWGMAVPIPADYDPGADTRSLLDGVVSDLAREAPSVPIATRVVEGHPAEVLVEASRHADLLVVASRGHGAFAGMVLGSVSQHCATHANCPVVIVRGEDTPA